MALDAARDAIYFRLVRGRRSVSDHGQISRDAKIVGAHRDGLRACAEAGDPAHGRNRVADDDRRDPYVNMLRTTIAVAAAGLGGADAITVLPHTAPLGLPDAFARRVARNTQLILSAGI